MKSLFLSFLLLFSASCAFAFDFQEGDIIGQSEINFDPSTVIFEAATSSRFGHVGIVLMDKDGQLSVYESTPPVVQITSIKDFMRKNEGAYAVIRKQDGLTKEQLAMVKSVANGVVAKGVPYNFSMVMNSESLNCSEFVKGVYQKAGIEVGRIEVINTLNINAFKGLFLKFVNNATGTKIDLNGEAVTPVSIMQTPGWVQVDGRLPITNTFTDRELFLQWKKENLFEVLEYIGLKEKALDKASK